MILLYFIESIRLVDILEYKKMYGMSNIKLLCGKFCDFVVSGNFVGPPVD